jgi:hypothetical protein
MATKAALEIAAERYSQLHEAAAQLAEKRDFLGAVNCASESLHLIPPMMQFERKYNSREFDSVETIDLILTFAPPLFLIDALDKVGEVLGEFRAIERNTDADMASKLSHARSVMQMARGLWTLAERKEAFTSDDAWEQFGGNDEVAMSVVQVWTDVRAIIPTATTPPLQWRLVSPFHDNCRCKCPSCGATGKGLLQFAMQETICPGCKNGVTFVILSIA